jgi:hypothetical protein
MRPMGVTNCNLTNPQFFLGRKELWKRSPKSFTTNIPSGWVLLTGCSLYVD